MYAVLLIGDEVLSAQVRDENMYIVLHRLRAAGYAAGEVRVVPDSSDAISHALGELAGRYEFVITAGGIGPTHDDITVEAVAAAFGVALTTNAEMLAFLEHRYGTPLTPMVSRMAQLPPGTTVAGCRDGHWPVISFRNVYILPGLPRALREKVNRIAKALPPREPPWSGALYLNADESVFTDDLNRLQAGYPGVTVGSYPVYGSYGYRSRVTVKGSDRQAVQTAWNGLRAYTLDHNLLIREDPPDQESHEPANEGQTDE